MTLYLHEMKQNLKSFLIWLLSVGGMCFGCILLYSSVEGSLSDMGDLFSQMGPMSEMLGMDKISISTMTGYYATEIAMIHSLGGAMFAAILGSNLLSKEEFGHTIEFLAAFPISRGKILIRKYAALVSLLAVFQGLCTGSYLIGYVIMEEEIDWEHMLTLCGLQGLLFWEMGTLCFAISAFSKRNRMGAGLGLALLFFAADLMCRIVPAIENLKYLTPFYYCNASDVFTDTEIPVGCIVIGVVFTAAALGAGWKRYLTKDFGA